MLHKVCCVFQNKIRGFYSLQKVFTKSFNVTKTLVFVSSTLYKTPCWFYEKSNNGWKIVLFSNKLKDCILTHFTWDEIMAVSLLHFVFLHAIIRWFGRVGRLDAAQLLTKELWTLTKVQRMQGGQKRTLEGGYAEIDDLNHQSSSITAIIVIINTMIIINPLNHHHYHHYERSSS